MENQQLVDYIKQSFQNGIPENEIRQSLINNGWSKEQIDAGFYSIGSQIAAPVFNLGNRLLLKVFLIVAVPLILAVVIFQVIAGGYFSAKQSTNKTVSNIVSEVTPPAVIAVTTTTPAVPPIATTSEELSQSNTAVAITAPPIVTPVSSNDLWTVFDQFNKALKNNDPVAYNTLSYAQAPSEMAGQFAEFGAYFYNENIKLNKADFVNKWQDDKQAIFSTNPIKDDNVDSYGYKQAKISFIKNNGIWKVLSVSPFTISWSVPKSWGDQGMSDLRAMMLDSDKDGLTDNDETCSKSEAYNPSCVKTDPNKRDTNNDGWWDGIEKGMK